MMRLLLVTMCALVSMSAAACRGGSDGADQEVGPSRPFTMGISTLPRDLNADAYAEAFDLAGTAGDIVLIQKAPPWEDLLSDGTIGAATAETTAAELNALEDEGLQLFFAIDPTDGTTGRDRLAGLPPDHQGAGFADEDIRRAFAVYAEYVAVNYKPRFLALGVEMNLYYHHAPGDFESFITLFDETYQRVKQVSPETQVTLTFQYEDLLARLPTTEPHFTDWQLLARFEPLVDVAAVSTYPSFVFDQAAEIPEKYYTQLRAFTDHPIVIAAAGYSSSEESGATNNAAEGEQAAYVERLLDDAERMRLLSVVWFAGWDPSYAIDNSLSPFRNVGLLRNDGTEKPAWSTWLEVARRPLATSRSGD